MAVVQAQSGARGERYMLFGVIAAATAMYAPTLCFLWDRWMADSQYSLAFLVPVVSGYFVWKKLPEVRKLEARSSTWGFALVVLAVLMHLGGTVLDISGPSGVSIIVFLVGGCLYFHGAGLVRSLGFPLAYTVFMIPIPGGVLDLVGFPMQLWASASTATLLRLIGMEVTRSGVNLSVPGFDFQVAQACSGMSSLVALVGVTAVFAYITRLPAVGKWALFMLSLPVALAANVARITAIALVGYHMGPEAATSAFHDWSSPILFLTAIIMLFIINWGLEWLVETRRRVDARRTTS